MSSFQNLATPAPRVEPAEAAPVVVVSPANDLDALAMRAVQPAPPSEAAIVDAAQEVEPALVLDVAPRLALENNDKEAYPLSVEALRANGGTDFEAKAAVIKGRVHWNFFRSLLSLIYEQRDFVSFGEVARFVLVKGNCIFVYGQETDPSPLYAIPLDSIMAVPEDPRRPDKHAFTISPTINSNEARANLITVLLKDRGTTEQSYQITFDTSNDKALAKRFLDVLRVNATKFGCGGLESSILGPEATVLHSKEKKFSK